jgi:SAM-dependent methyltransferase
MAIQAPTAELLILCKRRFPKLHDFVMIGRQWLRLNTQSAVRLSNSYQLDLQDLADPDGTDTIYADPLLQKIGFSSIQALDASSYQGAEILQDLNQPLKPNLQESCDCLLDGGSLEHVFDFPTAIRNCASMLRPGGLFVTICPVNNWMGHGFYQFSPELFFRVFNPAHGFSIRFAALHVRDGHEQFFALRDPARVGHRVQYNSPGRTTLMLVAQKLHTAPDGIPAVQQSDYSERWGNEYPSNASKITSSKGLKHLVPNFIRQPLGEWRIKLMRERKNRAGLIPCKSLAEAWQFWQEEDKL